MIRLTRLNGAALYLNSDLIEHIDSTPDTVVTLTSGPKFLVMESPDEICEKVVMFRKSFANGNAPLQPGRDPQMAHLDVAHG